MRRGGAVGDGVVEPFSRFSDGLLDVFGTFGAEVVEPFSPFGDGSINTPGNHPGAQRH